MSTAAPPTHAPRASPWLKVLAALAAVLAFGLGLAGFLLVQPTAVRPARVLAWGPPPPDAGVDGEGELWPVDGGGLELTRSLPPGGEVPLPGDPVVRGPRGWLVLPQALEHHSLLFARRQGPVMVAAYELQVEGPGPSVELLISEDDGATFDYRASVPKPNYLAMVDDLRLDGGSLEIVTSMDSGGPLHPDYHSLRTRVLGRVLPFANEEYLSPGTCTLRSNNLGRRFTLSCQSSSY